LLGNLRICDRCGAGGPAQQAFCAEVFIYAGPVELRFLALLGMTIQ